MSKSDERHKVKLAKRAESRKRHELRQEKRSERDSKLKAAFAKYHTEVSKIWAEWRATA